MVEAARAITGQSAETGAKAVRATHILAACRAETACQLMILKNAAT